VTVAWHHQQLSEGGPLGQGYTQVANTTGFGLLGMPERARHADPLSSRVEVDPLSAGSQLAWAISGRRAAHAAR
jgi:hypothetical protein